MQRRWSITNPYRTRPPGVSSARRNGWLAQTRVVRGEVGDLVVRDRFHQLLEGLERRITRAPPVRLEEEHLVREIAGGLPAQIGNALRGIALPGLHVADDALLGRHAAPLDGAGVDLDRCRLARLAREVAGEVVDPGLTRVLRVGLHLGRRPQARGVVLDRFPEIPGRDARDD